MREVSETRLDGASPIADQTTRAAVDAEQPSRLDGRATPMTGGGVLRGTACRAVSCGAARWHRAATGPARGRPRRSTRRPFRRIGSPLPGPHRGLDAVFRHRSRNPGSFGGIRSFRRAALGVGRPIKDQRTVRRPGRHPGGDRRWRRRQRIRRILPDGHLDAGVIAVHTENRVRRLQLPSNFTRRILGRERYVPELSGKQAHQRVLVFLQLRESELRTNGAVGNKALIYITDGRRRLRLRKLGASPEKPAVELYDIAHGSDG